MKKVFLHVGPHKTGTTATQIAYFRSRRLLAQNGVCYPSVGLENAAHHGLVDWARGWGKSFRIEDLHAETQNFDLILISSENFAHLEVHDLQKVREALNFGEVTVFFYLRRLVDLWPSHWQELIKHGQSLSFRDYISDVGLDTTTSPFYFRLDQRQQLSRFNEVFGAKNVCIVGYDWLRDNNVDLSVDLLKRLDPDLAGIDLPKIDANASRIGWQTSFLRFFNKLWAEQQSKVAPYQLRVALLQRLRENRIDWIEEFRAAELKWLKPVKLTSTSTLPATLQLSILENYRSQFVDDADAVETAYMIPKERLVHDASIPLECQLQILDPARALLDEISSEISI